MWMCLMEVSCHLVESYLLNGQTCSPPAKLPGYLQLAMKPKQSIHL